MNAPLHAEIAQLEELIAALEHPGRGMERATGAEKMKDVTAEQLRAWRERLAYLKSEGDSR